MLPRLHGRCRLPGLILAALFAGTVAAHPLLNEDHAPGNVTLPSAAVGSPHPLNAANVDQRSPSSDTLTRGGGEPVASLSGPARLGNKENSALLGVDGSESLSGLSRAAVDIRPQELASAASSPRVVPPTAGEVRGPGEDLLLALNALQESVTEALVEALDARVDRDGRVVFTVAGVDGFHFVSEAGTVTVGHGDTALTIAASPEYPPTRPVVTQTTPSAQPDPSLGGFNPVRSLIESVKEIAQHPLVWVVIFFLLVGKIALLVAHRRHRRRRHHSHARRPALRSKVKRRRSRSRQQSTSTTPVGLTSSGCLQEG
ncbi:hypothetical protein [Accumulibacter sp.]|uniref:hypothetical protein n=1 Tax=Accumulibacter sp. TaxID=2053492 RepID=UPI00260641B2|nr:hypothetical protein [Accumulibacter sp.]